MTAPSQLDIAARSSALYAIAQAHDRFSERAQIALVEGDAKNAAELNRYADWCLRAYRAELDDPQPKGRK